jgi:pseudaminic acid biosynthesis-associated methylase
MSFSTPQEEFWAGSFGTDYIERNRSPKLLAAKIAFFSQALRRSGRVTSCVEIGANIGMNLKALRLLCPGVKTMGVEINPDAAAELRNEIGSPNVFEGSILDWKPEPCELAFTKGVLIHINPEALPAVYDAIHAASVRLILIAEYYSPTPVALPYRGHEARLFKRDFAGEMMDRFDLSLIDYGFTYHRDPVFPEDDITWFLLGKP